MKDLTNIFKSAILHSNQYKAKILSDKLEKINNCWCRIGDDSQRTWYLISHSNGKSVDKYYGYLSVKYPVALVYNECPSIIIDTLKENSVKIDFLEDNYCCEKEILEKFIKSVKLIDDRFLYDNKIPFDYEAFAIIDSGNKYVNPYSFKFENIY